MFHDDIQKKIKTKKRDVKVLFIVGDSGTTVNHEIDKTTNKNLYSGFTYDIWQNIAEDLQDKYNFATYFTHEQKINASDYNSIVDKVGNGEYDVAIGLFHHTPWREKRIDFTTPIILDSTSVIHYPNETAMGDAKLVIEKVGMLISILLLSGLALGLILAYIDKKRYMPFKGMKYVRRVVLSTMAAMFGEMGFLTENASLSIKGMIAVMIIVIIATLTLMYIQAQLTDAIIERVGAFTRNDIAGKRLIGVKGSAGAEKMNKYDLSELKEISHKTDIDNQIVKYYLENKDNYNGFVMSHARALPLLKKHGFISSNNFGNQPAGFVVTHDMPNLLDDINISIMHLKKIGKLRKLCRAYYMDDTSGTLCSME